jgi:hypothetical protein
MSVHGEIRGFFLIRVKFNICIFYPSTLSIWNPSRAEDKIELVMKGIELVIKS